MIDEMTNETPGQTPAAEGEGSASESLPTPPERAPEAPAEPPEAEILREIRDAEIAVGQRKRAWEASKEETKNKKAMFDAAVDHLCKLIRSKTEDMPLFDRAAVGEAAGPVDGDVLDAEFGMPQEDDSWRDVPLKDVLASLPPSVAKTLEESGLKTLGEYADASGKEKFRLTEIPGIGPVKAEKIEQALVEFWERRKAAANPPPGEEELDEAAALDIAHEEYDEERGM